MAAKGDGTQPSPGGCKARLPRKTVHSTKSPVLEGEASQGLELAFPGRAQPWTRFVKSQRLRYLLALHVAQLARVGPGSPIGRGPVAEAPTLHCVPVQSLRPGWVGKPELEGRCQQEFAPSKPDALTLGCKSGPLDVGEILKIVICLSHPKSIESESGGGIRARALQCVTSTESPWPSSN